jgi:hypothetical protein
MSKLIIFSTGGFHIQLPRAQKPGTELVFAARCASDDDWFPCRCQCPDTKMTVEQIVADMTNRLTVKYPDGTELTEQLNPHGFAYDLGNIARIIRDGR